MPPWGGTALDGLDSSDSLANSCCAKHSHSHSDLSELPSSIASFPLIPMAHQSHMHSSAKSFLALPALQLSASANSASATYFRPRSCHPVWLRVTRRLDTQTATALSERDCRAMAGTGSPLSESGADQVAKGEETIAAAFAGYKKSFPEARRRLFVTGSSGRLN